MRGDAPVASSDAGTEDDVVLQAPGCYSLAVGLWSPGKDGGPDRSDNMVPRVVFLTARPISAKNQKRRVIVVVRGGSFIRFGVWSPAANGHIDLNLTNAFSGVTAVLARTPGGWEGQAHSYWDFTSATEEATLDLTRVECPPPPPVLPVRIDAGCAEETPARDSD